MLFRDCPCGDLYYACVRVLVTYMVTRVYEYVEGCDLCLVGKFMLWPLPACTL